MKRNTWKLTLTLAVVAVMALPLTALAQHPHRGMRGGPMAKGLMGPGGFGPGGHDPGMMLDRMTERLDLSDDQQTAIEAILEQSRPTMEALREQLAEARETFQASRVPGAFDEAAIRAFAASQSELHTEIMVLGAKVKSQIYSVLTPEQQDQMAEMKAKRAEMRAKRAERHAKRAGCPSSDG